MIRLRRLIQRCLHRESSQEAFDVEVPRLARLRVCAYPCHVCGDGLSDGDLIVLTGSRLGHAHCMVLVRERDGTHVSGEQGRAVMFLYGDEWRTWLESNGDRPMPLRNIAPVCASCHHPMSQHGREVCSECGCAVHAVVDRTRSSE